MRGIPYYNFPAFDALAARLRAKGHFVFNPADIDRKYGFDAMTLPADTDWSTMAPGLDLRKVIRRDVDAILECDGVFMMDGWPQSRGATAEHQIALWAGLRIFQSEKLL